MASGAANAALIRVGQLERQVARQANRIEKLESRLDELEKSRDDWRAEAMALRDLIETD